MLSPNLPGQTRLWEQALPHFIDQDVGVHFAAAFNTYRISDAPHYYLPTRTFNPAFALPTRHAYWYRPFPPLDIQLFFTSISVIVGQGASPSILVLLWFMVVGSTSVL